MDTVIDVEMNADGYENKRVNCDLKLKVDVSENMDKEGDKNLITDIKACIKLNQDIGLNLIIN